MIDTVQCYFRRILDTHKYLGTPDQKKVGKFAENNHARCHSSAYIKSTKVLKVF